MNKNKFRIVFNKLRGSMMAVPEGTKGHTNTDNGSGRQSVSIAFFLRPIPFSLLMMCGQIMLVNTAQADIVADPVAAANQRPVILQTANGLPLVNIQTPSAAGVSRNTYKQFDVKSQGAILNNSNTSVQTQLGGWVQGNPHLAGGTARIILNEVNSQNPSLLNGFIEVAGSRAQVVIANPAGISCNGCGFINANRATLTTGTPMMSGGNLLGYRVGGGTIQFDGDGMDSAQTNFTDVIARAVEVNAGIWANALNITTGVNQVNIDSNGHATSVTPTTPDPGNVAPLFAVDVAALGGMYAGKIHMVGTEAGVGVRNAGTMGASVGEINITADGMLQNTGSLSAKTNIQLDTVALENPGSIKADGDITIQLSSDYTHIGELQAGDNLNLSSTGDLINQSTILASQALTLNVRHIENTTTGAIVGTTTEINATDSLLNRGLIDGMDTRINAETLTNTQTGSIYGDHLSIQVAHLGNDAGAVISARDRLDIGAATIENRSNGLLFSAGALAIGGALDSNREATGSADALINEHGIIEALGNLQITANDIQNLNAGLETELVVDSTERIREVQPEGWSQRYDISRFPTINNYNIEAQPFLNENGNIVAYFEDYTFYDYTATTSSTHVTSSLPGQILSGGHMTLVGNITNSDSQIIAGGNLDVTGATVQNHSTTGEQIISYSGRRQFRDWDGNDEELEFGPWVAFSPASKVTAVNLAISQLEENASATGSGTSVASVSTPVVTGSLFQPSPDITANYLIETNPRFANYRTWLSSDYMLSQLAFDPATMQKRLGDGFYEQKLVREQIAQLTGRRFLDGFASDEAQYQALMEAGITVANAWQLVPGVALTAEQIAQLTSDIVWLVEETVTLPDGTITQALVPKVYVRLQAEDLQPTMGLMAGNQVTMDIAGDMANSGTIAGRTLLALNAGNIHNLGGQIQADVLSATASNNIDIQGGTLAARDALVLQAGGDITVASTTVDAQNRIGASTFSRTNIERVAGLYVTGKNGILVASAANDINLFAAQIINAGENGMTLIDAGSNLNLGTVTIAEQNNSIHSAKDFNRSGYTQEIGTVIQTQGDIQLHAGQDVVARAAEVSSTTGQLAINAGNDIRIESGTATYNSDIGWATSRSGTFSSRKKEQRDTFKDKTSISSTLSADTISLQAGQDIAIQGSNVVSDSSTLIQADGDISITSATNTHEETHYQKTKRSGISTSGASVSIGSQQLMTNTNTTRTTQTGSTVGSMAGDVAIEAGKTYTQTGSDVLAPQGDIDITAQKVDITAATDTYANQQSMKYKQRGITVSVSSSALNLAQNVAGTAEATITSDSTRNKALNTLQTYANASLLQEQGKAIVTAAQAGNVQDAANAAGVKLSVSIGSAKSESSSSSSLTTHQGSLVKAGGDISIKATQDDLTVAGSQIAADKNVMLDAARNINLIASADTENNQSKNKSSSTSIGVSVGVGNGGAGLSVDLAASRGKGNANSDSVTYNNTQVTAGETLELKSGSNTNLIGANASGNRVIADIGGDLNIESLQDTASSKAKQSNTGISVSVPVASPTLGNTFGAVSQSKQNSNNHYASVYEQSGIQAGEQGFNITTQSNTDLRGAVIDSKATADKNQLTTGTLTVSNIQNHMEAKADSSGLTLDSKMLTSKYEAIKGMAGNLQNHGVADVSDSSTTLSAISPATITITDEALQQQLTGNDTPNTIAMLNRDTSNTNRVLAKPDLAALQQEAQQQQTDRMLLVNTVTAFTDEAFRKAFLQEAKIYKIQRNDDGTAALDENGKPIQVELKPEEKYNLKPGENGKVNVYTNGIYNDAELAANYSTQMAQNGVGEVYLVYFPEANNMISELLIAGYQKFMENSALGLTNATQQIFDLSEYYGGSGLNLVGHSRGGMTIGNALEAQLENGASDSLSQTTIQLYGSAYNAQNAANNLDALNGNSDSETSSVSVQTHQYDFVGRILGMNPSTGGTVPEGSSVAEEVLNTFTGEATVHNCYGAPQNKNCSKLWDDGLPKSVIVQPLKEIK